MAEKSIKVASKVSNGKKKIAKNFSIQQILLNLAETNKHTIMRTVETKLFSFDELSDEAKEKAISSLYDINVDYDWWDCTYEDAANIGLKITSFDLDRNKHAKGKFIEDADYCARKIIAEHGNSCETYKLAKNYFAEYNDLVTKYSDGIQTDKVAEDNEYDFDQEADELADEFLKNLLAEYANILQQECDYLQSEKAIIETIEANEYEFTEDGNRF